MDFEAKNENELSVEKDSNETECIEDKIDESNAEVEQLKFNSFLIAKKEVIKQWTDEFSVEIIENEHNFLEFKGQKVNLGKLMRKLTNLHAEYLNENNALNENGTKENDSDLAIQESEISFPIDFDKFIEFAQDQIKKNWPSESIKICETLKNPNLVDKQSLIRKNFIKALEKLKISEMTDEKGFFAWQSVSQENIALICKQGFNSNTQVDYFCFSPEIAYGYHDDCSLMLLYYILDGEHVDKVENFFCALTCTQNKNISYCLPIIAINTNAENSELFEKNFSEEYNKEQENVDENTINDMKAAEQQRELNDMEAIEQDSEVNSENIKTESMMKSKDEPYVSVFSELRESSDTKIYRKDYMNDYDDLDLNDNLNFLTGKIKSRPRGDYIDNILKEWKGDYETLEWHHGYIQWLFPIRTQGMNYESHPLQIHELITLKENEQVLQRIKEAFKLMLDFYGMKMVNEETGELERSDNYKDRYENLRESGHNYLRITRILKCLGDFELESYQIRFLEFLLKEIFHEKKLRELRRSFCSFWIHTIKNDDKRKCLINIVESAIEEDVDKNTKCDSMCDIF